MKWRIALTVAVVAALFAAFAYLYVNAFVRKHQHAVILFVADGLDLRELALARQMPALSSKRLPFDAPGTGDARRRSAYRSGVLNLDAFWNVAVLGLQPAGRPVPDAGAAATALACGKWVPNGWVAMVAPGAPLTSLIYAAQRYRRATGLVTTDALTDPVPVAFYSTAAGTLEPPRHAADLLYSGIDVILGGGERFFLPAASGGGRNDGRDLETEMQGRGYALVRSRDELERVPAWRTRRLCGLFAPDAFAVAPAPGEARQPALAEMVRSAVSCLNYNLGGYFLVVQDGRVARTLKEGATGPAADEVRQVDEAIRTAVEYAGPEALVLVTDGYVPDPAGGPAWLASRGAGSAQLSGFFDATDLFDLMTEQF